jgi:23S rRNA pseudouridine1911/1915/1917 synthase
LSSSTILFHQVFVPAEHDGERLDKFLGTLPFISSRSRASDLIDAGFVTSKDKVLKASCRLQSGMVIEVRIPEAPPVELQPLNRPLDLLYEDQDLLVVNKPSGLVVHPASGHAQDTLVNMLIFHVDRLSMGFAENRPGIVHRLDRDTSGILVVAKNDRAHHGLAEQFRHKRAHRLYWAVVHGRPKLKTHTIRSRLARHPQDRKRFASTTKQQGKYAITHYKTLQESPTGVSWLACKLETGRTHQIRVHLSEEGLPIVGDPIYGLRRKTKADEMAGRLLLHACELGFQHPLTHENLFFRLGWPEELKGILMRMGFKNV